MSAPDDDWIDVMRRPTFTIALLIATSVFHGSLQANDRKGEPREKVVCYTNGCLTFPPLPKEAAAISRMPAREPEFVVSSYDRGTAISMIYDFGEIRFNDSKAELDDCRVQPKSITTDNFYYFVDRNAEGQERCRQLSFVQLSSLPPALDILEALDVQILLLSDPQIDSHGKRVSQNIVLSLKPEDFR